MTSYVSNRPCNIAGLMAAVLGLTLEDAFARCGLLLCPVCNKASKQPELYPLCGPKHYRQYHKPPTFTTLQCDECGKDYPKSISVMAAQAQSRALMGYSTGPDHSFCSNQCKGTWLGNNRGFALHTHPMTQLRRNQTHCKYGHPFDEANTYRQGNGGRGCRTCARIYRAKYKPPTGRPIGRPRKPLDPEPGTC